LNWFSLWRKLIIFIFFSAIAACIFYAPRFFDYFKTQKAINVLTFVEMISPQTAKKFTEQTGIKVNMNYFESNDELLVKLKINKGRGYDLILVTDFIVDLLIQNDLLGSIDVNKISNFKNLDKYFLNRYFDKNNKYSIPYIWTVFGLAYNKKFFGEKLDPSLGEIFENLDKRDYKISMINNVREAVDFARIYLFGKSINLSNEQLEEIRNLLVKQKRIVECYTSEKQDYLLYAEVVPLAVCESSFIRRMHIVDETAHKEFGFVIPKEGSIISIENLAILKSSNKKDLTYKFLDFLLSAEDSAFNCNLYGINPINKLSYQFLDQEIVNDKNYFPHKEMIEKMDILHNDISLDKLDDIWLSVKTA